MVGYALVGAGAFGAFCLDAYATLPGLRLVAVVDRDAEAAHRLAHRRGLLALSFEEALAHPEIELVHLATPPATHAALALRAFAAGKHVLCEKPLATTVADAEAMVAAARGAGLLLACNLVMRYDPLLVAVRDILRRELLGRPLRATFENYAKDAALTADHWFWDAAASGGIFIEHGVHFFDLFAGWFGAGTAMSAFEETRPGGAIIEAVGATVRHGEVTTQVYHGFHQADAMDRQEMRIVLERGDIRLAEWVPTGLVADFFGTEVQAREVEALLPSVGSVTSSPLPGSLRHRGGESPSDGRYRIEGTVGMAKPELYAHVVREVLADGLAWITDRSHARRVTDEDALVALRLASACQGLAAWGRSSESANRDLA